MEEAREQKSETQRFTDKFEGRYAIGVMVTRGAGLPGAVARVRPRFRRQLLPRDDLTCGRLALRAGDLDPRLHPLRAGERGPQRHPLQRGNHLENAGTVRTVAFDKTGTLTEANRA